MTNPGVDDCHLGVAAAVVLEQLLENHQDSPGMNSRL
jgi:hypothetical protein